MKVRIQCAPGQLGMGECLKQIVAEHGLRGLYRGKNLTHVDLSNKVLGMATPIAFATPVCAIAFSGKSWGDNNLLKNEKSARKAAISGCFGGGASVRVYQHL